MAQKINPTSLRLGILQLWMLNIPFYGKSFKPFFLLYHNYLNSYKFLKKLFNLNGFTIIHQQWKIQGSNIKLNIYYTKLFFSNCNYFKFYKLIYKILDKLFFKKIKIYFYLLPTTFLSNNLLHAYSNYLIYNNASIKKVLWNLSKILEYKVGSLKVISTNLGVKCLELKGYKICISGRIDNSKTQMAKSINFQKGYLCSTSLYNHIIYSKSPLYTKSGVCGVKIWLFYEFKL
nr:ribosomal protein S3 [Hypnea sp.]